MDPLVRVGLIGILWVVAAWALLRALGACGRWTLHKMRSE
jgi:hypothetical protein